MVYSKEYPVEQLFRDACIAHIAPVAEEFNLAHIATEQLNLTRTC